MVPWTLAPLSDPANFIVDDPHSISFMTIFTVQINQYNIVTILPLIEIRSNIGHNIRIRVDTNYKTPAYLHSPAVGLIDRKTCNLIY